MEQEIIEEVTFDNNSNVTAENDSTLVNNEIENENITENETDNTDVTNEFTELLEEYIKTQLEEKENETIEETDTENTDTSVLLDSQEDLQTINNDILSQILETELETKGEIVNQSLMMVDEQQNNTINSTIETISLDNFLTLVLIASILFTSVLSFARRIF